MTPHDPASAKPNSIVAATFAILVVWLALHYLSNRVCKQPEVIIINLPTSTVSLPSRYGANECSKQCGDGGWSCSNGCLKIEHCRCHKSHKVKIDEKGIYWPLACEYFPSDSNCFPLSQW
jgi:hypothetical protein